MPSQPPKKKNPDHTYKMANISINRQASTSHLPLQLENETPQEEKCNN